MLTLTNPTDLPHEWYFSKLERLENIFKNSYNIQMEWAGSVEKTKDEINHCHALVRFKNFTLKTLTQDNLIPGQIVFPRDWESRSKASTEYGKRKMNSYVYRKLFPAQKTDTQLIQFSKEGLKMCRQRMMNPLELMCFWYQCNYGSIADCAPIKSHAGVVKYALKYALKDINSQSIDWMISSGAVPTLGK